MATRKDGKITEIKKFDERGIYIQALRDGFQNQTLQFALLLDIRDLLLEEKRRYESIVGSDKEGKIL